MGEGRREVCWADWEMGMVLRGGGDGSGVGGLRVVMRSECRICCAS